MAYLAFSASCGRIGYETLHVTPGLDAAGEADADGGGDGPISLVWDASPGLGVDEGAALPPLLDAGSVDAPTVTGRDVPGRDGASDARDAPATSDANVVVPINVCASLPALPAPPQIDGVLDANLPLQRFRASEWTGGTSATPTDGNADFVFAWRPDGVYFYIRVTDTKIVATTSEAQWCEDSVELFVDGDGRFDAPPTYDQTGTRQFIEGAPPAASPRSHVEVYRMGVISIVSTPRLVAFPAINGWVVEGFVDMSLLGVPLALASGGRIGLNFALNVTSRDASTGCNPDGHFRLHPPNEPPDSRPAFDVRAFCLPTLAPR